MLPNVNPSGLQITKGATGTYQSGFIEMGSLSFRASDLIVTAKLDLTYLTQYITTQRHLCLLMHGKYLDPDNKTVKSDLNKGDKILEKLARRNVKKADNLYNDLKKLLYFLPYTVTYQEDGHVLYSDNHHVRYAVGLADFLGQRYKDLKTLPDGTEDKVDDSISLGLDC